MRILFTGFTSRTVGSEHNVYNYMCNVDILRRALELAGHTVDQRTVSLETDPCVEEDYDCALVGVAAINGLSSRYKLSGLWTLARFGKRAGIFPSDGKNVYIFPNSVQTCLTGDHKLDGVAIDPIEYMLGFLQRERNNVVEYQLGSIPEFKQVWREVLAKLPGLVGMRRCEYPVIVPTFSWGRAHVYTRHFGSPATVWDPTMIALPQQFPPDTLAADGRLVECHTALNTERKREWILSSLQDNSAWLKKIKPSWPVLEIGNKRKAKEGKGLAYVPEEELIRKYYTSYAGTLAFGYPLAEGGWWRMRLIHAALAGIVTCCDPQDAQTMPPAFQHSRIMLERWTNEKLAEVALQQHQQLVGQAWSVDKTVATVDGFVKALAGDR